jgi:hypothetical protein
VIRIIAFGYVEPVIALDAGVDLHTLMVIVGKPRRGHAGLDGRIRTGGVGLISGTAVVEVGLVSGRNTGYGFVDGYFSYKVVCLPANFIIFQATL